MSPLRHLLQSPAAVLLGWTLVHFLWQGVVVALGLAVWLRAARRTSTSQVRYGVAGATMLVLLACPVLTYVALATRGIDASAGNELTTAFAAAAPGGDAVAAVSSAPVADQTLLARLRDVVPPDRLLALLVAAWAAGVVVLSLRLLAGWLRVQRVRRSGVPVNNRVIRARLNDLARRMGIRVPVDLLESALAHGPAVVGALRPAILFPAAALTGLWPIQIEAILAHELAHIRRHDYLVNLLQSVVEMLLFYHPAVWWVSARVREEREHCCDDLAVEACGDRKFYAHCLADLDDLRPAEFRLAVGAAGVALLPRIRRILCLPAGDGRAAPAAGAAVALATTALVALFTAVPAGLATSVAAAVTGAVAPEVYDAPARMDASVPSARNFDVHSVKPVVAPASATSSDPADEPAEQASVVPVATATEIEPPPSESAAASETPGAERSAQPSPAPRRPHVPFPGVGPGALWGGGAWLPRLTPETTASQRKSVGPRPPLATDFPPPPPGFGDGALSQERLREIIAAARRNPRSASSNFAVPGASNFNVPTSPNYVVPNSPNYVVPTSPNFVAPSSPNFAGGPSNVARQPPMVNFNGLLFVRSGGNAVSPPPASVRPAPNAARAGRQSVSPGDANAVRPAQKR